MATSGFSYGKSAAEWNVLLYLWWLGVGFTPLRASRRTLADSLEKQGEFNNLMQQMINFIFVELWKNYAGD